MEPITISAASGLRSRMESLDMLANNIANESTGGYKADREFYSLYVAPEAQASQPAPEALPVIERPWIDFSQGELRATGNPLDFAIAGKGFFVVDGPAGALYTRDGNFRVSAAGQLVTAQGNTVRAAGGGGLTMAPGQPATVSSAGTVNQGGTEIGRIDVVDFPDPAVLAKQGHNYFQLMDPQVQPVAATGAAVEQGRLENSNLSSAEAAVRLIGVMREFETLQKAIGLGDEMNRRALEEVARV